VFLLSLVGQCDSSTIIYWQVRIFTCPPRSLKRGQDESHGTFQKYYLFIHFLFVGDFSFIGGCRKHECTRFMITKACSYCPLELGIVGYSDKSLYICPSLHMLTRPYSTRRPISASISLEECFCLMFVYCYSRIFRVSGALFLVPILFMCGPTRPAKSCSYLVRSLKFFWKVPLDMFTQDNQKKKRKTLSGLLSTCQ